MTQDTTPFSHDIDLRVKQIQGTSIPALGFGTWQLRGSECEASVGAALETGYRHIDTARMYNNEGEVGRAVKSSGLPREELWITSKIWMEDLSPETIKAEVSKSLELLKIDYLDLMLIHWPNPEQGHESAIHTLTELREAGLIRQLGVSNFTPYMLKEAMAFGPIFCNQVEYHPLLTQDALLNITRPHDIMLTAYSPLAHGLHSHPVLAEIGKKYGKSATQATLRWLIEQDRVTVIPRSSKPDHIRSNFDIFDFQLELEDLAKIEALPKDKRQANPDFAPNWDD